MIEANQVFSELLIQKATVPMVTKLPFLFDQKYYSLSVLSEKLYFLEIGPVHIKSYGHLNYDAEKAEFKFSPLERRLKFIVQVDSTLRKKI